MTLETTSAEDQAPQVSVLKIEETRALQSVSGVRKVHLDCQKTQLEYDGSDSHQPQENEQHSPEDLNSEICYNPALDNEIRSRLDKLNALSDLINSLERQFDEANNVFRETLKCSTDRLSSIAKTLGTKSIRHGRVYNAAKISVEQNQSDCQRACVQFEQANKDHQVAKLAIKEAEQRLRKIAGEQSNGMTIISEINVDSIDMNKLNLSNTKQPESNYSDNYSCDNPSSQATDEEEPKLVKDTNNVCRLEISNAQEDEGLNRSRSPSPTTRIETSAKLSEELNQAIVRLIEAESKRGQSEQQHMDRASKLMIAQENLLKLEREFGPSIRRTRFYFDEANRFNAKLSSVKSEICRISEDILAAKQAYARTLSELEQFSDDLHESTS